MRTILFTTTLASSLVLGACGGSSSSDVTTTGTNGTISGTVAKGPVSGATVTAFAVSSGTMGAEVGRGTADGTGHFTVSVGDHTGPIVLQASGGTYTDEATGTHMTVQSGDTMACAVPSFAAGETVADIQVTPLTSMAEARARHMTGGMTADNMTAANGAVGRYFSVSDIVHVAPMNPMVTGSGSGATPDARNYGMAMAAMSQYAKTLGMTSSSGIVTAMMDDASDGVMNGMMDSTAISMSGMGGMMGGGMMQGSAGTSGLAAAMSAYVGSSMNVSGVSLADMQALMDQLTASNGTIQ